VGNIKFEKRAVAFIDVLGFKSVVGKGAQNNYKLLQELVCTLETAVPKLNESVASDVPNELIPKHFYISDCIILSAPLTANSDENYCGLDIVIMRAIQLTHIFLNKGYLIRGGISIGDLWHTESNIIGPAYQEAYSIETKTKAPRIELSDTAKTRWEERNKNSSIPNYMCLTYDERFMVNGLHDYYIQADKNLEAVFKEYASTVEKNKKSADDNVNLKWSWFEKFLESESARN
jgi:hypothetical protein